MTSHLLARAPFAFQPGSHVNTRRITDPITGLRGAHKAATQSELRKYLKVPYLTGRYGKVR